MLSIERAICADIKDIHIINKESLPVYYDHDDYIRFVLDKRCYLLKAIVDNKIIGYILGKMYTDNRLHIMTFAINSDYRSKGYGSKLIDEIEKIVREERDINQITLYVKESFKNAIRFYIKNGFITEKRMRHYYGKNDHGYKMKKILK